MFYCWFELYLLCNNAEIILFNLFDKILNKINSVEVLTTKD